MAATKLCTTCGYVGESKRETKGSFVMELFLWLFVLPGFIYTIWRLTTRYDACPKCASPNLIPTSSPVAQKLLQQQGQPQPTQYTLLTPHRGVPSPPPSGQHSSHRGVPPPPPSGQHSFRIARNGQDLGELPVSTIKQMIASGQLSMQDYYFDTGANDWKSLDCLAAVV